jgi:hypothetical protein
LVAKAFGIQSYLKGDYPRSLSLLKESLASRAKDAEILYYLGRAQLQTKDTAGGRNSLEQSLKLGLTSELADAAKQVLESAK